MVFLRNLRNFCAVLPNYQVYTFYMPFSLGFSDWLYFYCQRRWKTMQQLSRQKSALIPRDALLTRQTHFTPHAYNFEKIFILTSDQFQNLLNMCVVLRCGPSFWVSLALPVCWKMASRSPSSMMPSRFWSIIVNACDWSIQKHRSWHHSDDVRKAHLDTTQC